MLGRGVVGGNGTDPTGHGGHGLVVITPLAAVSEGVLTSTSFDLPLHQHSRVRAIIVIADGGSSDTAADDMTVSFYNGNAWTNEVPVTIAGEWSRNAIDGHVVRSSLVPLEGTGSPTTPVKWRIVLKNQTLGVKETQIYGVSIVYT